MQNIYLVITPFFPEPTSFRGPYILDQIKAIIKNSNYEVVVMKPFSILAKASDYEYEGIRVYRFRDWSIPSNLLPNHISDWLSSRSLFQKLNQIGVSIDNIAVCHTHVTHFGIYAQAIKNRNQNVKAILQHHGFDVFGLTDGVLASMEWHKQWCIRYGVRICNAMDLNIGVSKKTLAYLKSYPGIRLKNEYVLYNGVDTQKFYPLPKHDHGKFIIGCIANFWALKDQMTLIRAVRRLIENGKTQILVKFVGTGATRKECEEYIAMHQLEQFFTFENEVSNEQLLYFYNSLDLFVLPSYYEAFGCVYTEAYACGIPFIGVKGQGIEEIINPQEKDDYLIEKEDFITLASLIGRIWEHGGNQRLLYPVDINVLIRKYCENLS